MSKPKKRRFTGTLSPEAFGELNQEVTSLKTSVLEVQNDLKILREACSSAGNNIQNEIENLQEKAENLLTQVEKQDNEIKDLKEKIKALRKENHELQLKVHRMEKEMTTLEAGQLLTVFERNVSKFVLQPYVRVGDFGGFAYMLNILHTKEIKKTGKGKKKNIAKEKNDEFCGHFTKRWLDLQKQCDMTWETDHKSLMKAVKVKRNEMAHQTTIDYDRVRQQIKDQYGHWEDQGDEIIELNKTVNCLLALGQFAAYFDRAVGVMNRWLEDNQSTKEGKAERKRWDSLKLGEKRSTEFEQVLKEFANLKREGTLVHFEIDLKNAKSIAVNYVSNKELCHYIIDVMKSIPSHIWEKMGIKSDVIYEETSS